MFGLSRLTAQLVASSAIAALLVGSCVVRDRNIEQRGLTKLTQQTDKINAQSRKARAAARAPGAVERVRKDYCRDC